MLLTLTVHFFVGDQLKQPMTHLMPSVEVGHIMMYGYNHSHMMTWTEGHA